MDLHRLGHGVVKNKAFPLAGKRMPAALGRLTAARLRRWVFRLHP